MSQDSLVRIFSLVPKIPRWPDKGGNLPFSSGVLFFSHACPALSLPRTSAENRQFWAPRAVRASMASRQADKRTSTENLDCPQNETTCPGAFGIVARTRAENCACPLVPLRGGPSGQVPRFHRRGGPFRGVVSHGA